MSIFKFQIKLLLKCRLVGKLIWVLNNFLTMECYRKLCNRFYWKKLNPQTVSYRTRFWMILISVLTATLLAFYYDPSDPTHSLKTGFIIILAALILNQSYYSLTAFLQVYSKNTIHTINNLSSDILDSTNISLRHARKSYLRASSFLI